MQMLWVRPFHKLKKICQKYRLYLIFIEFPALGAKGPRLDGKYESQKDCDEQKSLHFVRIDMSPLA